MTNPGVLKGIAAGVDLQPRPGRQRNLEQSSAMYSGHIAELAILLVCVAAFFGYHVFLYNFDSPFLGLVRVPSTMTRVRHVWTRSICADDKDVITGVQTIRNSLMTVTLFTVAAGYIGARAIPEILLSPDMFDQLNLIQVTH